MNKRTRNIDCLENLVSKEVTLFGWINNKRKLGHLTFIDFRDRSGIVQLVIDESHPQFKELNTLKKESVLKVIGTVRLKDEPNLNLKTGKVEVLISSFEVLSKADDLPFDLHGEVLEETRLKYRYLDIRRDEIKNNLILRHKVELLLRNYLNERGFIEVETPILSKSTPEGARDYLVPSRIYKNNFYALPQSPQIYKQLLMIGGIEKYFQIARCFRDEDLRSDRQPEFTQLDIEMSFAEEDDIFEVVEDLFKELWKDFRKDFEISFPRHTYNEVMRRFGSDKPDLRIKEEIVDLTEIFKDTNLEFLKNKTVSGILFKDIIFSRKDEDNLKKELEIKFKNETFLTLKMKDELTGSIVKSLTGEKVQEIIEKFNLEEGDIFFVAAGKDEIVHKSLGHVRLKIAEEFSRIDKTVDKFLWVVDFPMFELDDNNNYVPAHHPFTSPHKDDISILETDKKSVRARSYDLVLNGYELLSGSIRITDRALQEKVFHAIGLNEKTQREKFGFFIEAFKYGTPPHGGVGIGLERVLMILAGTENIKDVVAFPKTQSAYCLMSSSPSEVDEEQLNLLNIKSRK